MIPSPWVAVVLGLAVYRLLRLAGWDTFPPIVRARAWVTGEYVVRTGDANQMMGISEPPGLAYRYRRPLLAELIACAFCLGVWLSGLAYAAWLEWPHPTLYGAFPLALSAFAGLVAKVLDA